MGLTYLSEISPHLSAEQCQQAIRVLQRVRDSLEPPEGFIRRDRIWSQHAYGWGGHLYVILDTLGNNPVFPIEAFLIIHQRNHTQMHLLIAELAIRAHQLEQGTIPESLAALVPEYLPEMPADPYGDGPLMYRLTDDGYLLYSVGPDGDDDCGELPKDEDDWFNWSDDRPGDITLEMFAYDGTDENATLDENATATDQNADENATAVDENATDTG